MKKYLFTTLSAVIASLAIALPVFGIADPDTPPAIDATYVYEFEDGSLGVLSEYYLDYASTPNETAAQSFLLIFIDTDETTQLKSVAPYVFTGSGYGSGLIWIPFTAAEVTSYGLTSTLSDNYTVWLTGNPTVESGWTGDPPKTISTIDEWNDTGDIETLLALRVLYYADQLELEWSLDLVESTSLGNRLTTLGESYFENVIPNLRTLAPGCFSSTSLEPADEDIDYTTEFGAVFADGTGTAAGAPIALAEGANNVNITSLGTFFITLQQGVSGNATSDVCTVDGSPVDLVAGTNNITASGVVGNIIVTVELVDLTTAMDDTILGTGWDLTTLGSHFGMSRWMISGVVWMIMSVIICAAAFRATPEGAFGSDPMASKVVMVIFDLCIIGGTLLGLLKPAVAVIMFISFGILTGYVLFFRGANV